MENDSQSKLLATDEQLDDLNSSLNILINKIKEDTSKFPELNLLNEIKQCLECLANAPAEVLAKQRAKFVSLSWPADLRIVLSRIFRTFKIPEEYTKMAYELATVVNQSLAEDWLMSDPQFLCLLCSLSNGRLRIIMDKPSDIDMDQLIACLQLQEFFFKCVEDDREWMGDTDATLVSKCCQEAAAFACAYVVECAKEVNISLHMELFLVLYRYICTFLAIGGAAILEGSLLQETLPILLKVCRYCMSQRDTDSAWILLCNLPVFPQLPTEALSLLVEHTRLIYSSTGKEAQNGALIGLTSVMEQLKDRQEDWHTTEALDQAEQLAKSSRDSRLAQMVEDIHRRKAPEKAEKPNGK